MRTALRTAASDLVKDQTEQDAAYQTIRDTAFQQLVAAGHSDQVADIEAGLFAQRVTIQARREGLDPQALLEPYGIRFIGPEEAKAAAPQSTVEPSMGFDKHDRAMAGLEGRELRAYANANGIDIKVRKAEVDARMAEI